MNICLQSGYSELFTRQLIFKRKRIDTRKQKKHEHIETLILRINVHSYKCMLSSSPLSKADLFQSERERLERGKTNHEKVGIYSENNGFKLRQRTERKIDKPLMMMMMVVIMMIMMMMMMITMYINLYLHGGKGKLVIKK